MYLKKKANNDKNVLHKRKKARLFFNFLFLPNKA